MGTHTNTRGETRKKSWRDWAREHIDKGQTEAGTDQSLSIMSGQTHIIPVTHPNSLMA